MKSKKFITTTLQTNISQVKLQLDQVKEQLKDFDKQARERKNHLKDTEKGMELLISIFEKELKPTTKKRK